MSNRSILEDLASIAFPDPNPASYADHDPNMRNAILSNLQAEAEHHRRALVNDLSQRWDNAREAAEAAGEAPDWDPLLDEIARARAEENAARARMRLLFAFAREVVRPRPYRLEDLAAASGMSFSGVRTAYGPDEVAQIHKILGLGEPSSTRPGNRSKPPSSPLMSPSDEPAQKGEALEAVTPWGEE